MGGRCEIYKEVGVPSISKEDSITLGVGSEVIVMSEEVRGGKGKRARRLKFGPIDERGGGSMEGSLDLSGDRI